MQRSLIAASVIASILMGCNDAETAKSAVDTTVELSGMFPTDMMVASPMQKQSASMSDGASYSEAVAAIEDAGESLSSFGNRFDPAYFFGDVVDATCFGPPVKYENHPDSVGGTQDGELPSGDVGIWTATNGETEEACAAAELNSQMKGAASRVFMSLVSFAGMVGVAVADSSLPTRGNSTDLVDELNARISTVNFTTATLSRSSAGTWSYDIVFEYTNSNAHTNATTPQTIALKMEHHPGSTSSNYEGVIQYRMDDYFDPSGNCPADSGETGADITHNGSLHYHRNGDKVTLQHRFAGLCGHDQSAFTTDIADMDLNHLDATSTKWKNNFTIFTAEFDKDDTAGSYAYTWQAGDGDAASRILFVGLNSNGNNGEAYYGYGNKVQTSTSGDITGFYCNWAGPGNNHTLHNYAQRQFLTYDSTDKRYELSSSASSNITYAPVDSCSYTAGSGFKYDTDIDVTNGQPNSDALDDETDSTVNVDLMDLVSGGTTYTDIMSVIKGRGFDKPSYPVP
ncbi:hypothetical protein FJM67_15220 [Maribrevibacterium harenarium]|uniref:Lipoprotein n=1 Tax=Maribrevibacterium harenarium TaxID=2589817 RepID=A0A501WE35_9GAMM|nr:hypothetical protein [Maribrevibacterium harenarium]TPE47092.1 hypothetical protein FJM67_15220 [Maribrevibacterium harenarium]